MRHKIIENSNRFATFVITSFQLDFLKMFSMSKNENNRLKEEVIQLRRELETANQQLNSLFQVLLCIYIEVCLLTCEGISEEFLVR